MQVKFEKDSILLGKYKGWNLFKVLNLLILIIKQYIIANRYKKVPELSFSAFENII